MGCNVGPPVMRISARTARAFILLMSGLLLASESVTAHHSYATFDMTTTASVQGTVMKWDWTNPHSFLYLAVQAADGSVVNWAIECTSPVLLVRVGLSRKTFSVGDKVTVTYHPHHTSPTSGSFVSAIFSDGHSVSLTRPDAPSVPADSVPVRTPALAGRGDASNQ